MSEKKIKPEVFGINMSRVPILNERPPDMSMEDYKTHQKLYKEMLKLYRKIGINGKLVLPSNRGDMADEGREPEVPGGGDKDRGDTPIRSWGGD